MLALFMQMQKNANYEKNPKAYVITKRIVKKGDDA